MLIIEHDMPLITSVSDRMIALELGAIVTVGTPDEVITNPQVVSAYLGGDIDVINRSGASSASGGSGGRHSGQEGRQGDGKRGATRPQEAARGG